MGAEYWLVCRDCKTKRCLGKLDVDYGGVDPHTNVRRMLASPTVREAVRKLIDEGYTVVHQVASALEFLEKHAGHQVELLWEIAYDEDDEAKEEYTEE